MEQQGYPVINSHTVGSLFQELHTYCDYKVGFDQGFSRSFTHDG